MDKRTAERLAKAAPTIGKFLLLDADERKWLFPILGMAERRAILIIECIEGKSLTFEEISSQTDTHKSTVRQILYALSSGGMHFQISISGKWQTLKGGEKEGYQ